MVTFSKAKLALGAVVVISVFHSTPGFAQMQGKFSYDALVNCHQPSLSNFPVHGEGTGTLLANGSATLATKTNVDWERTYEAKLGAKRIELAGGSASFRVNGRRSLRVVVDAPNNFALFEMTATGRTCRLKVENHLKPGKKEYTFTTPLGIAYCDRPIITKAVCELF